MTFPSVERVALLLGVLNGLVLLAKPIPRIHSRLDVVEARLSVLSEGVARLENRVDNKIDS